MPQKFRLRRLSYRHKFESHLYLQERRWWGWNTIDREDIPHHVLVSLGCFGDTGGWSSKFWKIGTVTDGDFTPHDPSMYAREPSKVASCLKRLLDSIVSPMKKVSCA
jgi:hypothetical protein